MDRAVHLYFAQGIAQSTASSYSSAQWRYLNFCNLAGVSPLPVTELSASRFVVHLATQGLRAQSIAVYLSALRHLQVSAGLPSLVRSEWPRLSYVLRGVKRSQSGLPARTRLLISGAIMRRLPSLLPAGPGPPVSTVLATLDTASGVVQQLLQLRQGSWLMSLSCWGDGNQKHTTCTSTHQERLWHQWQ